MLGEFHLTGTQISMRTIPKHPENSGVKLFFFFDASRASSSFNFKFPTWKTLPALYPLCSLQ